MKELKVYLRKEMADAVIDGLAALPAEPNVTVVSVRGWGHRPEHGPPEPVSRIKLEIVVRDEHLEEVMAAILERGSTGHPGDGHVYVTNLSEAVRITDGQRGPAAIP